MRRAWRVVFLALALAKTAAGQTPSGKHCLPMYMLGAMDAYIGQDDAEAGEAREQQQGQGLAKRRWSVQRLWKSRAFHQGLPESRSQC